MKILLIILLPFILYAQDVIPTSKGSGRYLYTPITGTYLVTATDLFLYGSFTRVKDNTGASSASKYIVWKYTNGTYDSTRTLALNIDNPLQDTTGTYYCSVLYRLKNGTWVWEKGADSTFTIGTTMLSGTYITTVNGNYWTTQDGKYITVE